MREFSEISKEPGFKKFLYTPSGTLYMIMDGSGYPELMIRHFDGDIPIEYIGPYCEIIQATRKWIEKYPQLDELIRVELITEIGRDFIVRPFHVYQVSTDSYVNWDNPPDPPQELQKMRSAFEAITGTSQNKRDQILEAVLARNILEPSYKTYFDEASRIFIIIEPRISHSDIENWLSMPR
ncbi:MAG: hypothetical protein MJE77_06300 [Proteobacteria bacterium]|nr:hypothetical protein [Pseudomonadota bacterium]